MKRISRDLLSSGAVGLAVLSLALIIAPLGWAQPLAAPPTGGGQGAQGETPVPEAPMADPPAASTEQPAQTGAPDLQSTAQNQQPAFFVHAELTRPTNDFREGDSLSVRVRCEIDAYLYVLYQQADGKVFQIFPNKIQQQNKIAAKQEVVIPASDDLFRWKVGPPFGKEVVKVVACKVPVDELAEPTSRAKNFNPISNKQLKDAAGQIAQMQPSDWAEVDLELYTYAASAAPAPQGAKRIGVFFGVSEHQFDAQQRAGTKKRGKERGLNLRAAAKDAQSLGTILREIGGLNQARIFTNEQVTRATVEEVITRWLPSVSKPGDTVIIHYSGHGSQIADDNGDETRDQQDEVLVPYDMVNPLILEELLTSEGQLDGPTAQRAAELLQLARQNPNKEWDALVRATGISDDLFGRWLQNLNGRQVVVILDTCHSGGFATAEKGIPTRGGAGFDFLEGELTRLKDIGAQDQAMLSAAMTDELAMEHYSGEFGLLTGYLLKSLVDIKGPVKLEDCHAYCEREFPKYFELVNQALEQEGSDERVKPHHAFLTNNCVRPVFLKP